MSDLISKATSKLETLQKTASKTSAAIENAKAQFAKKVSEYDSTLQSGNIAKMEVAEGAKSNLATIISDLEKKYETEKQEIDLQIEAIKEAKIHTERIQFADTQQTKLNDVRSPYNEVLSALQNSISSFQVLSDVLEENGLSNDEHLAACFASHLRYHFPSFFKSEYIKNDWKTFLEVRSIENGKLGQYYEPQDKTPSFDKAFQSLFLKPLLNQIDGLRAGMLDIPVEKTESVEIKPEAKPVRKTIDVLKHFYATYQGQYGDPEDKPFYAYKKYVVPEAFANAAIDTGYALDTSDPDYPDKLKRHQYTVTVANKPIKEDEISVKNTPHLGDPGGFLSNSED